MVDALGAALPHVPFDLTVRGASGMAATDMLRLLDQDLAARHFALVIWQTGTVEAVHGVPASDLEATLVAGARRVQGAGSDLILIGPQFSRLLNERTKLGPYTDALAAAARPGAVMFDRLDLTRHWVEDGGVDLERVTTRGDRQAMLEVLHACVGDALAHFVLNGGRRR